jgi:hypothetical protein
MAPDWLVISDHDCTRDCCPECMVVGIMIDTVRVQMCPDMPLYRLQYRNAKSLMEFVNARRLPKKKPYRHCLNTLAFACFAPIRALDRLRISRFGHFLVRSGLVRDRTEAHCEDERSFASGSNIRRETGAQAAMEDADLRWTISMAFFATSGGCVHRSRTGGYLVLGHPLIADLIRYDPLSLLPVQRVVFQNPGKANAIAKAIACVQAFWFCSQCVARLRADQAVSLLELNTFAHCISTLLIYGFWWNKPYDAEVHAFIESSWLDLQCLLHELSAGHTWPCPTVVYGARQNSSPSIGHFRGSIVDANGNRVLRITEWETRSGPIYTEYGKLLASESGIRSRARIPNTGLYFMVDIPDAIIDVTWWGSESTILVFGDCSGKRGQD